MTVFFKKNNHRFLSQLMSISLCWLSLGQVAHALPEDANQPIRLSADKATYSQSTGTTRYLGNVVITQGSLKITAQALNVELSDNRSIRLAVATGTPATFEQIISHDKGLAKGQANKIDYNATTGIVTLTGNAKLSQGGASFSGNTIRYSLKMGDIEASAGKGQRVELVFPPSEQNPQGVRP